MVTDLSQAAPRKRPFLVRVWNLPRTVGNVLRAASRKAQQEHEAMSPEVLAFWRGHGGDWAKEEASAGDLETVSSLADRLAPLSAKHRKQEVVTAFRRIWEAGFSNPAIAFPWDDMHDNMPPDAMLAFVDGAAAAAREKRGA